MVADHVGSDSLTYLVLSLFLLFAFYMWRFTVWAHQVGGYWALMTGHHITPAEAAAKEAASSASASSSVVGSTATVSAHPQNIKVRFHFEEYGTLG